MAFLREYNINLRLWGVLVLAFLGMLLIAWFSSGELKNAMYDAKNEKNKHLIELAHGIIAFYHDQSAKGVLTETEAKTQALDVIRELRYDTTNYFWINDYDARVVMHAVKPNLDNQDLSNFADPTGNKIYAGFARLAKEQGEGVYEYMFPKPNGTEPLPKFSYIKGFAPWQWAIGTGTYVDDVDGQFHSALVKDISFALLLSALFAGILILIIRSIVIPIKQANAAMEDIASGSGNLNAKLSVAGNDELTHLSSSFNTFVDKIRTTIMTVEQSVNTLLGAANDLADTNAKSSQSAEQQSQQMAQIVTAVGGLTSSLKSVSESSTQVSDIVKKVDEDAQNGVGQLGNTVTSIDSLNGEINTAVEVIDALAAKTDTIGGILDVIRGIAEQTNLLALNAAIEAARAGEQGRGFAVVADEVRTLASRTQESTEEIDQMIAQLQQESKQAVDVINTSQARATETVDGTQSVRMALETISGSVAQLADMGNQNAYAMNQQSATVEEINQRVENIYTLAQQSSGWSADAMGSGEHVKSICSELKQRMSLFSC